MGQCTYEMELNCRCIRTEWHDGEHDCRRAGAGAAPTPPSPRGSNVNREGQAAASYSQFGLDRQLCQTQAMQQQASYANLWQRQDVVPRLDLEAAQEALAVSEKERERLKAELMSNTEHLTAVHWKDEAEKLRRELETEREECGRPRKGLDGALGATAPSPRASNEGLHSAYALGLQADYRIQRGADIALERAAFGKLQEALAVSEKERERLKAIVDGKLELNNVKLLEEQNRLRKDLAYARSATVDWEQTAYRFRGERDEAQQDLASVKRELDRERAKSKRGL